MNRLDRARIDHVSLYKIDHLYPPDGFAASGTYLQTGTFLLERRDFMLKSRMPQSEYTMNIFYIIGVVVVVLFIAGFFGLHA